MLSTRQKRFRVMIYGTLGTACVLALIMALAAPDEYDISESQTAAVCLALLVGSNKAFNAKPIFGHRMLGAMATFIGTGFLPATIVYVALANQESGQSVHLATLFGFGVVTIATAVPTLIFSNFALSEWQAYEERQRQRMINATPSWVPRLDQESRPPSRRITQIPILKKARKDRK